MAALVATAAVAWAAWPMAAQAAPEPAPAASARPGTGPAPAARQVAAALPDATVPQRETAAVEHVAAPRPVDAALAAQAGAIAQELGLSPSAREVVADVVQEHATRKALLVAQWRSDAGREGADQALRDGLEELPRWRRQALQGHLGVELGALVADLLHESAARRPPPLRSGAAVAPGAGQ